MTLKLLPHQIDDAKYMAQTYIAGNFSEMGTGKTLTALEAVRLVKPNRLLIVAPPAVLYMWQRELLDHCGRQAHIMTSKRLHNSSRHSNYIMTYDRMRKHTQTLSHWLLACESSVMILDEAHALKNWEAKRTQAIFGVKGLYNATDHTWCLTGTPITRWADDIYPFLVRAATRDICRLIGGETHDTEKQLLTKFQMRYCLRRLKKYHKFSRPVWEVYGSRNDRIRELNKLLYSGDSPPAIRRSLRDVADSLPNCTHTLLIIDDNDTTLLTDEMKTTWANARLYDKYDPLVADGVNISQLRQALGLMKVPAATAHIKEVIAATTHPVLIGAWHHSVILALRDALLDNPMGAPLVITGATPSAERDNITTQFNDHKCCALIGQIQAAGTGLNLQKGGSNRIVIVEESASPQDMEQFYARLVRIGQRNHVHVDTLRGTSKLERALVDIAWRKNRDTTTILTTSNTDNKEGRRGR